MPEGVPARAILRFVNRLEARAVNLHGFCVLRGGRLAAEGYWKPFGPDMPHRLFSVGKSFTSLAIGMLEADGKLRLENRIAGFFEDKLPPRVPGPVARTTLRDMLRMATPHRKTTYKEARDGDWTRTFFTVPPTNEPGAVFAYDTSATHTLSALVERLSGQSLKDFLAERLFAPLGLAGEIRWLTDPVGVCQGGSGLIMTLPDLARVAACCLRGGDGLVPEGYLQAATAKQIDTSLQPSREERFGYGYQFWRTRHDGYAMYGMGGQLAVVLPRHDFILCTVADTQLDPGGVEAIYEALWTELLPALGEGFAGETEADREAVRERLAGLALRPVLHRPFPWPEGCYAFEKGNGLGLEALQITRDAIRLVWTGQEAALPLERSAFAKTVLPGTDGGPCLVSAGMAAADALSLRVHGIGDTPYGIVMRLAFQGERVTVQSRAAGEAVPRGFDGVASGARSGRDSCRNPFMAR